MNNNLLNKLKNDIDKKIDGIGGIEKFNSYESANEILTGWLNELITILDIRENHNRFEEKIDNKNYINCYFKVSSYKSHPKAMIITLYGVEEDEISSNCYPICICTAYHSIVAYRKDMIALKEEYVELFKKLNIVTNVISTKTIPLSESRDILDYADNSFCICQINQENLKKFCKEWNYQYE